MARRQFSEAEKERFAVERREQLERWQAEIAVGPFPVWWTLVRFAVPDRVKGS